MTTVSTLRVAVLLIGFAAPPLSAQGTAVATVVPADTLTRTQRDAIQQIVAAAELRAAPEALAFAKVVRRIYDNMLADHPDSVLRVQLAGEMKELAWQLLDIKGQSIRDVVALLSASQKTVVRLELNKPDAPQDLQAVIVRALAARP